MNFIVKNLISIVCVFFSSITCFGQTESDSLDSILQKFEDTGFRWIDAAISYRTGYGFYQFSQGDSIISRPTVNLGFTVGVLFRFNQPVTRSGSIQYVPSHNSLSLNLGFETRSFEDDTPVAYPISAEFVRSRGTVELSYEFGYTVTRNYEESDSRSALWNSNRFFIIVILQSIRTPLFLLGYEFGEDLTILKFGVVLRSSR